MCKSNKSLSTMWSYRISMAIHFQCKWRHSMRIFRKQKKKKDLHSNELQPNKIDGLYHTIMISNVMLVFEKLASTKTGPISVVI